MLCVCVRNTRKFAIVAHFMFSSCGDLYGEYNRIDAVYEYENWCNAFQIGPFSFDMNRRHIKLGENIVVSDLSGYYSCCALNDFDEGYKVLIQITATTKSAEHRQISISRIRWSGSSLCDRLYTLTPQCHSNTQNILAKCLCWKYFCLLWVYAIFFCPFFLSSIRLSISSMWHGYRYSDGVHHVSIQKWIRLVMSSICYIYPTLATHFHC